MARERLASTEMWTPCVLALVLQDAFLLSATHQSFVDPVHVVVQKTPPKLFSQLTRLNVARQFVGRHQNDLKQRGEHSDETAVQIKNKNMPSPPRCLKRLNKNLIQYTKSGCKPQEGVNGSTPRKRLCVVMHHFLVWPGTTQLTPSVTEMSPKVNRL